MTNHEMTVMVVISVTVVLVDSYKNVYCERVVGGCQQSVFSVLHFMRNKSATSGGKKCNMGCFWLF